MAIEETVEQDTPVLEAAEDNPSIETIAKLSDEELSKLFGFPQQIADARAALNELAKIQGPGREMAERRIKNMFTPSTSPRELGWIVEDAKRENRPKQKGTEAACDCSPSSVL